MRSLSVSLRILVLIAALSLAPGASAQTLSTLYTFAGGINGANPVGRMVFDKSGNLYGVTVNGGTTNSACVYGCGTVFELSPSAGGWTQTVIYSFTGENGDGAYPVAITIDPAGNLFGITSGGGSGTATCGCGAVFELSPGTGGWTEQTIYSFKGIPDGQYPNGNILIDKQGNLYGTTGEGGIGTQTQCYSSGCGTVWEVSPMPDGRWKEAIIHSFLGLTYGEYPNGLAMDAAGNLYGATEYGGFRQDGAVYKLSPTSKGWIGGVIFRLSGVLGYFPVGTVALDRQGNIYLSAEEGTGGNIVEVSPGATGWTGQIVASFPQNTIIGHGLTTDAHGNIYGATTGMLFELETLNGTPQIVPLATLDQANEGSDPGLPIFDARGNLFFVGVTGNGTAVNGTVFEFTP